VIKYQNPSEIDSLKTIIASLKRLMGSETSMLDDEKEEKKKAYSLNLDVRDILNECLKII
jgi:histidinol phosphatase-like PHP family hydrolase